MFVMFVYCSVCTYINKHMYYNILIYNTNDVRTNNKLYHFLFTFDIIYLGKYQYNNNTYYVIVNIGN